MQLRGTDIEETKHMDSQFYLVNSTHIIGKTRSSIVFQNNETFNMYNNSVYFPK